MAKRLPLWGDNASSTLALRATDFMERSHNGIAVVC